MTTITLSPIKRCFTSPNLKKHCIISSFEKQNLPDILNDIFIEQQRKRNVINIARILRKVGDQIDEQLQIDDTLSSNCIFGQRTITFTYCLSHVLRFFL